MGVRGLWKVIEPTARPVMIEKLRGKILAIDASIWIYHFVKAMRDPSGTIIRAAHIIGFFRRICKLLFWEIKPVFVFDGAAPTVKKMTTARRQHRRQGREYNARSTANKLLTLQLQRIAQEKAHAAKLAEARGGAGPTIVGSIPDNASYLDENGVVRPAAGGQPAPGAPTTETDSRFIPTDQYHLPDLAAIAPVRMNDQRLLTEDELEDYAQKFTDQAREGFIDTTTIDFNSPDFEALPLATRYQLLNTARLKSRLRMGYNTGQLREMFPDKMEFSRFQIERVAQRNYFAQRVLNMVGFDEDLTRRVSSEKNREYLLKRNDEGWTLAIEEQEQAVERRANELLHKGALRNAGAGAEAREASLSSRVKEDPSKIAPELGCEPSEGPAATMPGRQTEAVKSEDESSDHEIEVLDVDSDSSVEFEDVDLAAAPEHKAASETQTANLDVDQLFNFENNVQREQFFEQLRAKRIAGGGRGRSSLFGTMRAASTVEDSPPPTKKSRSLLFSAAEPAVKQPTEEAETEQPAEVAVPPWFEAADKGQEFRPMEAPEEAESNLIPFEDAHNYVFEEDEDTSSRAVSEAPIKPGSAIAREYVDLDEAGSPTAEAEPVELLSSPVAPSVASGDDDIVDVTSPEPTLGESATEPAKRLVLSAVSPDPVAHEPTSAASAAPGSVVTVATASAGSDAESPVELTKDEEELANDEAQAAEEEDEDLTSHLINEAQENERFARELNQQQWTQAREAQFRAEISNLRKQYRAEKRDADNVTDEMVEECQELLQLFGIPYITAPTEAEAQCAELESLGLIDGVVTDDGDCFLFGKVKVYRNFFNQAKFVESYDSELIVRELGLDREKLISLALLLGSDYTDGLPGVGPVTGVEILAEFGTLERFREWWTEMQRFPDDKELGTTFRRRFLKQFGSKLFLGDDFPDRVVMDAYRKPTIDPDSTPFHWGAPDVDGIRGMMRKFAGWEDEATDAVMLPVIQETKRRELLQKTSQASLDDYVTTTRQLDLGSKRANSAASKLRGRQ